MAFSITDSLLDQLVSSLVQALWNRPELSRLREPIEATLQGNEFKQLAREAFQSLADHTSTARYPHMNRPDGFAAVGSRSDI